MRIHRYIICASVAGAVVVSAGVAVAEGGFTGARAVPAGSSARPIASLPIPENARAAPSAGLSSVPQDLVSAFRVFRRLKTQYDTELLTNDNALRGLYSPQKYFAANPSLARKVYTGPQGTVYLVPAKGQVCLATIEPRFGGVSVSCVAISYALSESRGIKVIEDDGVTTTVIGAVPDGVRSVNVVDGKGVSHHVTLSPDNGYWVSVPAHATKMSMTDVSGNAHELSLPSAAR